jgi:methylenetetrahydrofolate--tRNA-(uracil-5-)-methyltransferase
MNVNFGLFPPITVARAPREKGVRASKGLDRKRALATRALAEIDTWLAQRTSIAAE